MAKKGIKVKEHENITPTNILKVIELLNSKPPITKKQACEILNISYNTTRLDNIIKEYLDKKAKYIELYNKNKLKPVTPQERKAIIEQYLSNKAVNKIAETFYRPISVINNIIKNSSIPIREQGQDYWNPPMIPDGSICETFSPNELVYSVRYSSLATIIRESESTKGVYQIWLESEEWQQFAFQPWWELASLKFLNDIK